MESNFVQQDFEIGNLDLAEVRPVFTQDSDGKYFVSKKHQGIWNVSKNELACVASKGYKLVQHRDAVRELVEAMRNLNIKYDMDIREDGHRIFVDVDFPESKIEMKEVGEEFTCGLRFINSYDKTTGILVLARVKRLACSNGMMVNNFVPSMSISHTQKLAERIGEVIGKGLYDIIQGSNVLKKYVSECMKDSVEWKLVEEVFKNIGFRKKHIKGILANLERKSEVTRWELYNAVTAYATHGQQIKPRVQNWLSNKAKVLLEEDTQKILIKR